MKPEWMVDLPDICTQDVSNYAQKKLLEYLIEFAENKSLIVAIWKDELLSMLKQLEEK